MGSSVKKTCPGKKKSKRQNRKKIKSNSKSTWEKFLNNKDSRNALSKSWTSKNPQRYYDTTIKRLAKKYSNKK